MSLNLLPKFSSVASRGFVLNNDMVVSAKKNEEPRLSTAHARALGRADYAVMARRMVLHGVVTRQQLIQETGLSSGSVTKHTKWLQNHDLVRMRRLPVVHAKKPIDELWLNDRAATILIVMIRSDLVMGELLGLELKPIYRYEAKLAGSSQGILLQAMEEVVQNAQKASVEFGRKIDFMGVCVAGIVEPEAGIIYSMHSLPEWEACQPWEIRPVIHQIPQCSIWPQTACKVRGWCEELKRDRRVAYVDCSDGNVSLAAIRNGEIHFGMHGTPSQFLHLSATKTGPQCYCGRAGCFHQYLRAGTANSRIMVDGLRAVFKALPEQDVAVEWRHPSPLPEAALKDVGIPNLRIVHAGEDYALRGLRAFTAEMALDRKVRRLLEN